MAGGVSGGDGEAVMTKSALLFLSAASFFIAQNFYFGWNATPKSDAELVADGITAILISMWLMSWAE